MKKLKKRSISQQFIKRTIDTHFNHYSKNRIILFFEEQVCVQDHQYIQAKNSTIFTVTKMLF